VAGAVRMALLIGAVEGQMTGRDFWVAQEKGGGYIEVIHDRVYPFNIEDIYSAIVIGKGMCCRISNISEQVSVVTLISTVP